MDCSMPGFPVKTGACSNSCPLSHWCHPTISSLSPHSSSCLKSFPESGSFPMSWLLTSVQLLVMSDSLWPHELQHARPTCPSPTPRVHSNSRPSSQWCHLVISSSVVPFSSCPQSLPASESFPMSQLFAWGGQSIGASALASFLPKNTQDWFPLFIYIFFKFYF